MGRVWVGVLCFVVIVMSMGCGYDGEVEHPDGGMGIMTPETIHGHRGHLVEFTIGDRTASVVDRVVVQLQDRDITDAVLYLSVAHTLPETASVARLIAMLKGAAEVSLVPLLPEGVKQEGGVILSFGEKGDPAFLTYLKIVTETETVYWSVRGHLGAERGDWFLTQVRKPPKVIDTQPARVVAITYYRDELLSQPLTDTVFIGDTIYSKAVFSKEVPITLANDGRARPRITSVNQAGSFQYHMRPRGSMLASGEAMPLDDGKTFVAVYHVTPYDLRTPFYTTAGDPAVSGNRLTPRFYKYVDDMPANTGATVTAWNPTDIVGQVFTIDPEGGTVDRLSSVPLPGVTVTIMSGPRAGESIVTDRNGRYRFLNVSGDTLHLRTDRQYYEPKEVIVHRSGPTVLSDGSDPNHWMDPQEKPGNILIGQVWPDEVRFIFEETLLPYDLLYVEYGSKPGTAGSYYSGLVILYGDTLSNTSNSLTTFAHEFAHAHQHAIASVDGSADVFDRWPLWRNSPEGKAYAAARAKDWAEVGEAAYDSIPYFRDRLRDSAAEICSHYWGTRSGHWDVRPGRHRNENLKETAPNRYRWAAEWLPKK